MQLHYGLPSLCIIYLTGVRSEKITLGDPKLGSRLSDVLNLVHPKVASEDERVWSFPHDNDTNDTDVRQRYRSPIGKKAIIIIISIF